MEFGRGCWHGDDDGIRCSRSAGNSISRIENARAKERSGYYLSRQDREKLRQYGRESEHGWGYRGYGHAYDYGYDGPFVFYGPPRYYEPYGY